MKMKSVLQSCLIKSAVQRMSVSRWMAHSWASLPLLFLPLLAGCSWGNVDCADDKEPSTYYLDRDDDGYGDEQSAYTSCTAPDGYIAATATFDCDDSRVDVHPDAEEVCGVKNYDCKGNDGPVQTTLYLDSDEDGYGNASVSTTGCDVDGYVTDNTDCDDTDTAINPAARETCDGVDNDCSGTGDDVNDVTYYLDADGDGFGGEITTTGDSCSAPGGYVLNNTDCNDSRSDVNPAQDEDMLDGVDTDCDGGSEVTATVSEGGSIQFQIDRAVDGAVIAVTEGTYRENLNFTGKSITLVGIEGAGSTTVEGTGNDSVLTFVGNGSDTVVRGFTITGGTGHIPTLEFPCSTNEGINVPCGGGVYLLDSAPTLIDLVITSNTAKTGGGISMLRSSPSLIGCMIEKNGDIVDENGDREPSEKQTLHGGGLFMESSTPILSHCRISGNEAYDAGGMFAYGSGPSIDNCSISNNEDVQYGGIYFHGSYTDARHPVVSNCEIFGNLTDGVRVLSSGPVIMNTVIRDHPKGYGLFLNQAGVVIQNCVVSNNGYGGIYLPNDATTGTVSLTNSILVGNGYQPGHSDYGNLYIAPSTRTTSPDVLVVSHSDFYPGGLSYNDANIAPYKNVVSLDVNTILNIDPGFVSNSNFHLPLDSDLIDAGTGYTDPDGSPADLGIYGGPCADAYGSSSTDSGTLQCGWDMDADGYYDYFWPGTFDDVPATVKQAAYDRNDADPLIH